MKLLAEPGQGQKDPPLAFNFLTNLPFNEDGDRVTVWVTLASALTASTFPLEM